MRRRFRMPATTPSSLRPSQLPPASAVAPGDDVRPVGPVAAGRLPGRSQHLVAVGAEDDRPGGVRATEDHHAAHAVAARQGYGFNCARPSRYNLVAPGCGPHQADAPARDGQNGDLRGSREGLRAEVQARPGARVQGQGAAPTSSSACGSPASSASAGEAEAYAKSVVAADFEKPGDDDVVEKVMADFKSGAGAVADRAELRSPAPMRRAAAGGAVASRRETAASQLLGDRQGAEQLSGWRFAEHPGEDRVDMLDVVAEVEQAPELARGQDGCAPRGRPPAGRGSLPPSLPDLSSRCAARRA